MVMLARRARVPLRGTIWAIAAAIAIAPAVVVAQDPAPLGPTAVTAPPAPEPAAPAPVAAPAAPAAAPPAVTPPAPAASPAVTPPPMVDPFRPDRVADTQGDPFRSGDAWIVPAQPPGTTTQTTTVVVTERVTVPPLPPPPPPSPPPAVRRPFVSGYGGLQLDLSTTSRRFTTFTGVHGGLLLGERLSIGASIRNLTRRFGPPIVGTSGNQYRLLMSYGGLELGAVLFRRDRFEFSLEALLGAGVACISRQSREHRRGNCVDAVRMAVVQPGAFIHLNLTNWMRVGLGGGYRFVARQKWKTNADFKLAAPYFGMSVDFGWFRR